MAKRPRKLPASATNRDDEEPLRSALEKTGHWVADRARSLLRHSKAMLEARAAFFELRQRLDLTQEELAEKLGVSLRTITRYESEGDPISLGMLSRMGILAIETGHPDLADRINNSFAEIFKMRHGPDLSIPVLKQASNDLEQLRDLLRSFRDLWDVFQPNVNDAEYRIKKRLDELVSEMTSLLLPEKEKK